MADRSVTACAPARPSDATRVRADGPDRARLAAFLRSERVVAADGVVGSWWNPDNPGFAYPEAAALWLSWAAWRRDRGEVAPTPAERRRVTRWLARALAETGTIGKAGKLYLFDTCLAAQGLARTLGAVDEAAPAFARSLDGVERFLAADRPVLPGVDDPRRWSDRWYGQQDRGGALLLQAGRIAGDARAVSLARRLRARTDDRHSEPAYVHALLYGVEGELLYRALGEPPGEVEPDREAARLVGLQTPEGALPAWTDGTGGPRSDATAQAVRIWCALDPRRFAAPIDRALRFLRDRQYRDGGVDYGPGRGDRTTWVALFVDQAVAWAQGGAEHDRWL